MTMMIVMIIAASTYDRVEFELHPSLSTKFLQLLIDLCDDDDTNYNDD
jgi:hypothetical protein